MKRTFSLIIILTALAIIAVIVAIALPAINTGAKTNWDIELITIGQAFTKDQCLDAKNEGVEINECIVRTDYWAKAMYLCHKKGKHLPSKQELKDIAAKLYGMPIALSSATKTSGYVNNDLKNTLGLVDGVTTYFWSSEEYTAAYSSYRIFSESYTNDNHPINSRGNSSVKAFCLGD